MNELDDFEQTRTMTEREEKIWKEMRKVHPSGKTTRSMLSIALSWLANQQETMEQTRKRLAELEIRCD